jgi:glycosyltransferase involved in cell wall biosynthesis
MACGLPIVTANGEHMDDLINDDVSIRINPLNVDQIRISIQTLRHDKKRRRLMSKACLEKAKRFDINERAQRVSEWMEELIRNNKT